MSEFKSALHTVTVPGGFELTQELIYHSDYLARDIICPSGFFTDFASVPRILQSLVPTSTGQNRRPSVVHDRLCDPIVQAEMGITQRDADIVFREALAVEMPQVQHGGVKGFVANRWQSVKIWGLFLPVRVFQAIKSLR